MRKSAREQAIDKVIAGLQERHSQVRRKISNNLFQFKKLTEEQTVLKREAAEIAALVRDLTKKKEKTNG